MMSDLEFKVTRAEVSSPGSSVIKRQILLEEALRRVDEFEHQRNLLAHALGELVIAAGIVRSNVSGITGPELLLFAGDLKEELEKKKVHIDMIVEEVDQKVESRLYPGGDYDRMKKILERANISYKEEASPVIKRLIVVNPPHPPAHISFEPSSGQLICMRGVV